MELLLILVIFGGPIVLIAHSLRQWNSEELDAKQATWEALTMRGVRNVSHPTWDSRNGPRPRRFLQDIELIKQHTSITSNDLVVDAYVRSGCDVDEAQRLLGGSRIPELDLARIQRETGADFAEAKDAYEKAGWNDDVAIKLLGSHESRELAKKLKELETLHRSGMLSDEEQVALRKKALGI